MKPVTKTSDTSRGNQIAASLSDRLLDSCVNVRGDHLSNSNSNSNSFASEYCKKNVLDMVPLEVQVVNAYLDQKMATLRAVIAAGNALSYALGINYFDTSDNLTRPPGVLKDMLGHVLPKDVISGQ